MDDSIPPRGRGGLRRMLLGSVADKPTTTVPRWHTWARRPWWALAVAACGRVCWSWLQKRIQLYGLRW